MVVAGATAKEANAKREDTSTIATTTTNGAANAANTSQDKSDAALPPGTPQQPTTVNGKDRDGPCGLPVKCVLL